MKSKTDEEMRLRKEWNEEIRKFEKAIKQMPRDVAAYPIIKGFMELEDPPDDLRKEFLAWFASSGNADAREKAFEEYPDGMLKRKDPVPAKTPHT